MQDRQDRSKSHGNNESDGNNENRERNNGGAKGIINGMRKYRMKFTR